MSEKGTETKEVRAEDIKKAAEGKRCPVQKALFYMEGFLDGPMCGKCYPCEMGAYEAKVRLTAIIAGRGAEGDVAALRRIGQAMLESSRCKKGKDTAGFLLDWLRTENFLAHLEGRCPDMECLPFVEYTIAEDKCTLCGLCKNACRHDAVFGEKKKAFIGGYRPFTIRQKKCVKCDECRKVCPAEAVLIVEKKKREPVGA